MKKNKLFLGLILSLGFTTFNLPSVQAETLLIDQTKVIKEHINENMEYKENISNSYLGNYDWNRKFSIKSNKDDIQAQFEGIVGKTNGNSGEFGGNITTKILSGNVEKIKMTVKYDVFRKVYGPYGMTLKHVLTDTIEKTCDKVGICQLEGEKAINDDYSSPFYFTATTAKTQISYLSKDGNLTDFYINSDEDSPRRK
ncbi:hypothetical protein [Bacillus cereus group sp. BfR-BA-01315]|uniref:hypothetical protein n=1 Tax=Bacillus cereus group sp. BfR-BA-01315 TaxID=2920292 RepID=UPI001F571B69|nr:hypothetical protein [Bacillus cereus group sp. BfR-BA-01315]